MSRVKPVRKWRQHHGKEEAKQRYSFGEVSAWSYGELWSVLNRRACAILWQRNWAFKFSHQLSLIGWPGIVWWWGRGMGVGLKTYPTLFRQGNISVQEQPSRSEVQAFTSIPCRSQQMSTHDYKKGSRGTWLDTNSTCNLDIGKILDFRDRDPYAWSSSLFIIMTVSVI